jgi:hypothetical protein
MSGMRVTEKAYYSTRKTETENRLQLLGHQIRRFSQLRLLSFSAIFLIIWILRDHLISAIALSGVFLLLFLWLVWRNAEAEKLKKRSEVLLQLINLELKILQHDFLEFPDGAEYSDPHHPYSYDLDLFGKGSLYQLMNRTTIEDGSRILARLMMNLPPDAETILLRQEAVQEIAALRDWRLEFLTEGNLLSVTGAEKASLTGNLRLEPEIRKIRSLHSITILLPVLTFLSLLFLIAGGSHLLLMFFVMANWSMIFYYRKEISVFYGIYGNKAILISKYLNLLRIIESHQFKSRLLIELQNRVLIPEKASQTIGTLKKIMDRFEIRQNILPGIILNSFLLWDIRCILQLIRWQANHQPLLNKWLETVEEFDAIISPGIFADHHSAYTYPLPVLEDFRFSAKDMGHPLLKPGKCVTNDFYMAGTAKIVLITGANMAGKSTFLRSVGMNMVLAGMGCPVFATQMTYSPVGLYTSMRTTDSLLNEESYFLAEIKRLSLIMSGLRNREPLLVILDEMLKGTNSDDKLKGSQNVIRELVSLNATTILATHDVQLTAMEIELPGHVENYCFEITHDGDELVFDYKLRPGATKTMNASILMRKFGIVRR